jgi:hypothetical protein
MVLKPAHRVPYPTDDTSALQNPDQIGVVSAARDEQFEQQLKKLEEEIGGSTTEAVTDEVHKAIIDQLRQQLEKSETSNKRFRSELMQQNKEVLKLRAQYAKLQHESTTEQADKKDIEDDWELLVVENSALRKQMADMERFLNDYGMVWIGGKEVEASQKGEPKAEERVKSSEPEEPPPDFGRLFTKLDELNDIAGADKAMMLPVGADAPPAHKTGPESDSPDEKKGGMCKFMYPTGLPLTIFHDGIILGEDGEFRPYGETSTKALIRDVMDGYFPYEFKDRYPEGVVFKVIDQRSVRHEGIFQPFQGKGRSLNSSTPRKDEPEAAKDLPAIVSTGTAVQAAGERAHVEIQGEITTATVSTNLFEGEVQAGSSSSSSSSSSLLASGGSFNLNSAVPSSSFSVDALLGKVAESKDENKEESKNEAEGKNEEGKAEGNSGQSRVQMKAVGGGSGGVVVVQTPIMVKINARNVEGGAEAGTMTEAKEGELDMSKVVTLKVKFSDGKQVLLLKMLDTDTIDDVHQVIREQQQGGEKQTFQLRTAFPNKAYDDLGQTLQEAGLAPNATLLLKRS